MRFQDGELSYDLAPDLVEEVLVSASKSAGKALRQEFLDEREAIGSIEIVDIREESFRDLDLHWAKRLRIADPLFEVVREVPALGERISRCAVERVGPSAAESAVLRRDEGDPLSILSLSVKAETLFSRDRLRELVRGALDQ
jgi:hypothetical protein